MGKLNGVGLSSLRRGMGVLTPQTTISDQPGQYSQPVMGTPHPPVGTTGGLTCPPGFVAYPAYTDPAGNYEFPGCQLASGGTTSPPSSIPPVSLAPTNNPLNPVPPNPINNPNTPPTSVVAFLPGSGQLPKGTGNTSNIQTGTVYRFILHMGGGYATGANYNGCSQTNSALCDPQFFNTLHDAISYALTRGEIPYEVLTTQEPWDIIAGTVGIDPSRIYNADGSLGSHGFSTGTLALLAIGAFFLLRRRA